MYIDEVLDYLKCGKKIRRTIWPSLFYLDKKEDDLILSVEDLLADDWEVIEDKKQWWEPKKDEEDFYYIINDGIDYCFYNDDDTDKFLMAIGNCFQTEEQAKFMIEKLKVIHELEKFAYENNEKEIDWNDVNQTKYHLVGVFGDKGKNYIKICSTFMLKELPFNIYFISKELAKKAIETIGEDRIKKYYFGVNEE